MDAWTLLGLEPTKDKGALRRAWAKIVKQHRPDQDPQKYQQLREAYEAAQRYQAYDDEEEGEEADDESVITYRFTPQTSLTPQDEPLPQAETVTLADWDAQTLNEQAQALATTIVADEMAGCGQLETFLATGLPDALAARRYFSERLADALSQEQWLTRGMLEHVGRIMGWELDHYRSTALPDVLIWELEARIATTEEEYRMVVERGQHQANWLSKARWRLISEPQAPLLYVVVIIGAVLVVCLRPRMRVWWRWPIDIISGPLGFPVNLISQLPWIINLLLIPFGSKVYSAIISNMITLLRLGL